jgi:drug/metabolite transporter (DMT)-like permease
VTPAVFAIVGVSALLHAAWNVMLKTTGDPLRTSGRLLVSSAAVYLPLAIVAWFVVGRPPIPTEVLAIGVVSGLLQTLYFILLSAGYRRGDLSLVYPIARGSAPLFAVLFGVTFLGERLGFAGWLGVACLLAAVIVIQRPWRFLRGDAAGGRRRPDSAILFAIGTGLTIASYSAVDRVGARLVAPWLFAAIFFPLSAVFLAAWIRFVDARRSDGTPQAPPASWGRATVTGLISLAAYTLILVAYTLAPLTVVAPLRESAVVLVSGWGSLRMREATARSETAARLIAAGLVVLGVALLAFSRA